MKLERHSFCKIMSIDCSTLACCLLTWIQSPVRRQVVEIPVCKACLTKWSHLGLSTTCRSSNWDAPEGMNGGNFTPWTTSFHSLWDHPSWELSISILWSLCSLLWPVAASSWLRVLDDSLWMGLTQDLASPFLQQNSTLSARSSVPRMGSPVFEMPLACTNICPCRNWAAQNVTGEPMPRRKERSPMSPG